jgi:CBS-domain-containing membrane protein
VMSRDVRSCDPNDLVATAEEAMRERHVRRLPVVDSAQRLVGIVSLNDVARAAAKPGAVPVDGLALGEVAQTLASVCQPWCNIHAHPTQRAPGGSASRAMVAAPALSS